MRCVCVFAIRNETRHKFPARFSFSSPSLVEREGGFYAFRTLAAGEGENSVERRVEKSKNPTEEGRLFAKQWRNRVASQIQPSPTSLVFQFQFSEGREMKRLIVKWVNLERNAGVQRVYKALLHGEANRRARGNV